MVLEKAFKIVLVGNSKVGKTALLIRYKSDTFMDPNFVIYEGISTDVKRGNVIYRIHLADIGGNDEALKYRKYQYSEAGVFMLCFAVNDMESYSNIQRQWLPEIRPFVRNRPLILVGTKSDLKTDNCVNTQQAKKLQKQCQAMFYVECSAKDGTGINRVIKKALMAYKNSSKPKKRRNCIVM